MSITAVQAAGAAATQAAAVTANQSTTPAASSTDGLATESTFLKLLVAQIQNQDPLQPTDSMQYITQLAQFSSLEQLININHGISTLDQSVQNPPANASTPPAGGTPNAAGSNPQTSKIS
jgi:flagellar basal-body rod modification protein FlgD